MDEEIKSLVHDGVEKALARLTYDKGSQKINVVEVANNEEYFTFQVSSDKKGYAVFANPTQQMPQILTIPDQYNGYFVNEIGEKGFMQKQQLNTVIIPKSIATIRDYAFYACSNLNTVVMLGETPPSLGAYVFGYTAANLTIYVPVGAVDAYKNAPGWKQYSAMIKENNLPDPDASGNTIINVTVVVPVFNNSNNNIILTNVSGAIGEKCEDEFTDNSQENQ